MTVSIRPRGPQHLSPEARNSKPVPWSRGPCPYTPCDDRSVLHLLELLAKFAHHKPSNLLVVMILMGNTWHLPLHEEDPCWQFSL